MTTEPRPNEAATPPDSLADLCSLSPAALDERWAMVRHEILPSAIRKRRLENGVAWDFTASEGMRTKLERLAELERRCCEPLDFRVRESRDGQRLRFEITGVDPDGGFFDRPDLGPPGLEPRDRGGWKAHARRAGLAAATSFVLCCAIPAALVSVLGLRFAAPLRRLDDPIVMGAGTVLFAGLFWLHDRRRARQVAARSAGGGPILGCDC